MFGWLGSVRGMVGDQTRGTRRPQNPVPGSRKGGAGRLPRGVVWRKAVLGWALQAAVKGSWMGYIQAGIRGEAGMWANEK